MRRLDTFTGEFLRCRQGWQLIRIRIALLRL